MERKPLLHVELQSKKANFLEAMKRRHKFSCVHSKGALLVILWAVLASNFGIYSSVLLTPLSSQKNYDILTDFPSTFIIITVSYLLYPLLGLLGERWARYKVMIGGTILCCISYIFFLGFCIIVLTDNSGVHVSDALILILSLFSGLLFFSGLGLFEANVVQFGADQLLFAPSNELSCFVRWFVFMAFFPSAIGTIIESILLSAFSNITEYRLGLLLFFSFLFLCLSLLPGLYLRHHIATDATTAIHPLSLMWKVIKYAWKHSKPERRSAFTYGDPPPSRLDLGKERYGGPFTTEQIEDVRTFWNIFLLILLLFGYSLQVSTEKFSAPFINTLNSDSLNTTLKLTFVETVVLQFPIVTQYIVTSLFIILLQLVAVPYFSRYIPNILKRLWIGLITVFLQSVVHTVLSVFLVIESGASDGFCESSFSSLSSAHVTLYVLLLSQICSGLSTALILTSGFELILAQGPRSMQGLLVGIWFMQSAITTVNTALYSSSLGCHWQYYSVMTCLIFLSLLMYSIAAYKYKYRQRNESSDVNEKVIITQYTERQLARRPESVDINDEFSISIL